MEVMSTDAVKDMMTGENILEADGITSVNNRYSLLEAADSMISKMPLPLKITSGEESENDPDKISLPPISAENSNNNVELSRGNSMKEIPDSDDFSETPSVDGGDVDIAGDGTARAASSVEALQTDSKADVSKEMNALGSGEAPIDVPLPLKMDQMPSNEEISDVKAALAMVKEMVHVQEEMSLEEVNIRSEMKGASRKLNTDVKEVAASDTSDESSDDIPSPIEESINPELTDIPAIDAYVATSQEKSNGSSVVEPSRKVNHEQNNTIGRADLPVEEVSLTSFSRDEEVAPSASNASTEVDTIMTETPAPIMEQAQPSSVDTPDTTRNSPPLETLQSHTASETQKQLPAVKSSHGQSELPMATSSERSTSNTSFSAQGSQNNDIVMAELKTMKMVRCFSCSIPEKLILTE
jgi:hypothetical protein